MQLYPDRLSASLEQGLKPYYLIFGDEPQQKLDAMQSIREEAKRQGFDERLSFAADGQFDWSVLLDAAQSMSLFASRQLIELELPTGKPGAEGAKAIMHLNELQNPDVMLVLHGQKIGKDVQNAKWFKTLDQTGAYIPCYPVEGRQLQNWVRQRLANHGLPSQPTFVSVLADYCEGNLMAADQEIQKLALLYADKPQDLTEQALEQALVDQSRFNVFQLMELLLAGEKQKAIKVLGRLESEGLEPNIILWALVRELQLLMRLTFAVQQGQQLGGLWTKHRIWKNRQGFYQAALQRLDMQTLERIQGELSLLDQQLKSQQLSKPYIALCHICMGFLGFDTQHLPLGAERV